jgi:hypothetical protein
MDLSDLKAVETILNTLQAFEAGDQQRILRWVGEKLGLSEVVRTNGAAPGPSRSGGARETEPGLPSTIDSFDHVAELLAAARPRTDSQRALLAATYLQFKDGQERLTGQLINTVLKDLGHQSKNITDAITALMRRKPALMVQIAKTGSSRQARKVYKVTHAGREQVARMLAGVQDNED